MRKKENDLDNNKDVEVSTHKRKSLKDETKHGILTVSFFALSIFFILASFNVAGSAGDYIYSILSILLGIGYFLIPILLIILSVSLIKLKEHFVVSKAIGASIFLISSLGIIEILDKDSGGILGRFIAWPFLSLFDYYASLIFLIAIFIISILTIFDTKLNLESILMWIKKLFKKETNEDQVCFDPDSVKPENVSKIEEELSKKESSEMKVSGAFNEKNKKDDLQEIFNPHLVPFLSKEYIPPPLSILQGDRGKPGVGDIKANANIIKRTFANFGIDVEMDEVCIGPTVTRYSLKPAEGVKLSRIIGLQNNLSLALAAHPLRIEAPIPGKSLVGIEVPNSAKTIVGLSNLLSAEEFRNSDKPLLITLGKDITGKSHFANIAKMPHMLIAGATGSGKSVTIHAIIASLLYRNSPENLRFIMIDPKRVELTLYNKIPHLLTPVITDAKKAVLTLKWATKEMDRRLDILEAEAVRDIQSYHKNVLEPELKKIENKKSDGTYNSKMDILPETMPYIVIIIDELADIMQTYPREFEAVIVRLAQMSRAVGIHLVLSTQRPSVNVITGLIKANIPGRVALQVSSQIDSRTILDTGGAEKLLGAGDMLYLSGEMANPHRIQSAFITEEEVKKITKYLADNYESLPSELNLTGENVSESGSPSLSNDIDDIDDDLYEAAREEVIKAGKASTSYLQRKLRIGYARAASIVDMLEERGVIGPADGSRPREVIDAGVPSDDMIE
ncbi:MAG: DNA translocase FtsK [Candidatus Paceibacterota bacterium]